MNGFVNITQDGHPERVLEQFRGNRQSFLFVDRFERSGHPTGLATPTDQLQNCGGGLPALQLVYIKDGVFKCYEGSNVAW